MSDLDGLRREIIDDPANDWARQLGYRPLFVADPRARVLIISQAPGRRAQESGVPWDDPSGTLLRSWLGLTDDEFYDPHRVAILPMDFYFPGKGVSGDLPPRKDFAPTWHPPILARLTAVRLTVVVGAYAQRRYLGTGTLTENVRAAASFRPLFPIVHPSPLARGWRTKNPWFETVTVPLLTAAVQEALGPQ